MFGTINQFKWFKLRCWSRMFENRADQFLYLCASSLRSHPANLLYIVSSLPDISRRDWTDQFLQFVHHTLLVFFFLSSFVLLPLEPRYPDIISSLVIFSHAPRNSNPWIHHRRNHRVLQLRRANDQSSWWLGSQLGQEKLEDRDRERRNE